MIRTGLPLALMLAALSGCATLPPESMTTEGGATPVERAQDRRAHLEKIRSWQIKGRIGIQKGDEGFSAAMEWQQNGGVYDIRLFDPLGKRVAWLVGNERDVSLLTPDGRDLRSNNPQQLLQDELGWSFPVTSLFYWVRGLPDPASIAWREEYDALGRLNVLEQAGWTVNFDSFLSDDALALPKLTRLARDDTRVKVLVSEWR